MDNRKKRIGGKKVCEQCGKSYTAFRDWDKYCPHSCGSQVRLKRFWDRKLKAEAAK